MAGRILPVALATVSGVAIGMATFGEELKAQRMKRLTDEYNREITVAAAASSENPAAIAPAVVTVRPPPASAQQITVQDEAKPATTSWSDALGFWAWRKKPQQGDVPIAPAAPAVAQEAPVKSTIEEHSKRP